MRRRRLVVAIGMSVLVGAAIAGTRLSVGGSSFGAGSPGSVSASAGEGDSDAGSDRSSARAPSYSSLSPTVSQPIVITAGRRDTSPALHSIAPLVVKGGARSEGPENPARPVSPSKVPRKADPVVQVSAPNAPMPSLLASFDGVSNVNGVLPP